MIRRPPRSTRTDTLFPYTTLFRSEAFVDYTAQTYGVDPAKIPATLAQAEYKQSIIDAISRPAEKVRPWRDSRPIFMNAARIRGGQAFYPENRAAPDDTPARTGLPTQYIVATTRGEPRHDPHTGRRRALDTTHPPATP